MKALRDKESSLRAVGREYTARRPTTTVRGVVAACARMRWRSRSRQRSIRWAIHDQQPPELRRQPSASYVRPGHGGIPTFQQAADLDPDGDGALSDEEKRRYLETIVPRLASNLDLRIGGERVPLSAVEQDALYKPGVGGLKLLRIESVLTGALPSGWEANGSATYTNRNYEDRLGWREIVVRGGPDVAILRSTAPTSDVSNELRAYPEDSLATPLDHREASFTLTSGYGGPAEDTAGLAAANVRAGDSRASTSRVAALISPGELTPRVMLVALLAALLWGAAHASHRATVSRSSRPT
ncbi:MAG: hypothetical protein WKH64_10555 [Chloroflexia bacterium]